MNESTEKIKPFLIDYIQEVTKKSKGKDQYICPFCHSGTGRNATGAFTYYPDTHSYNCFACGENGDIFTFHAKLNNLSLTNDFPRIMEDLENKFSIASSPMYSVKPASKSEPLVKLRTQDRKSVV